MDVPQPYKTAELVLKTLLLDAEPIAKFPHANAWIIDGDVIIAARNALRGIEAWKKENGIQE